LVFKSSVNHKTVEETFYLEISALNSTQKIIQSYDALLQHQGLLIAFLQTDF